ncbi:hypothetical protein [Streptomyces sp. NPDC053560]|uniref:hypothetical protein n=1 Tax=Streptomyces sp. NPDC053560 TaxID=3365711 RepID=UPI0037D1A054
MTELAELASAGALAVIQAAGTDAWWTMRDGLVRVFGRGDAAEARATAARLDRTAAELTAADDDQYRPAREAARAAWCVRLTDLLEGMPESERAEAEEQLATLLAAVPTPGAPSPTAGDGGLAVHGDVSVQAEGGSVAGGVINGGVRVGDPSRPGGTPG